MRLRRFAVVVSAVAVALLAVEAALWLLDPQALTSSWLTTSERGYALNRQSTTVTQAIPSRSARYQINSLGFRGAEPARADSRVLVVGDSMTFGVLLEEPDTFVSRIASSAVAEWGAGTIGFMNAAVGGWGAADYTAFIEDRGDELQPDVVLVSSDLMTCAVPGYRQSGSWRPTAR